MPKISVFNFIPIIQNIVIYHLKVRDLWTYTCIIYQRTTLKHKLKSLHRQSRVFLNTSNGKSKPVPYAKNIHIQET